jgi:ABC-2 type transport system permease protein
VTLGRESLARILAVVRKEAVHLRRDRLTLGMVFGIPVMQLLLFGYAINQDVRHLRAGVADLAGTARSRAFVADADASQVVDVLAEVHSAEELETLLRQGEIVAGLLIPHDFERRVARGRPPYAQLLVDGSDPVVLSAALRLAELPLPRDGPAPPTEGRDASFEVRAYYNPERRSPVQIVPGLVGVILTMTMTLFTAVAIVRERERGNLELLITTPVRTPELMVGKIVPYMMIGLVQVTLILLIGSQLFDVPIRGTVFDAYAAGLVFVMATLGLGLLISTLAQTQFQAFQLTFFSFLPQILLSGFMFPFDGMPRPAQWLAEIFPLTHFVRIIRGILLRGATLGDVTGDLVPLGLFFLVVMGASTLRFRKRLD